MRRGRHREEAGVNGGTLLDGRLARFLRFLGVEDYCVQFMVVLDAVVGKNAHVKQSTAKKTPGKKSPRKKSTLGESKVILQLILFAAGSIRHHTIYSIVFYLIATYGSY